MNFSKKDQKQIEGRFKAMYDLLTAKRWMQGAEAQDKNENEVDPTDKTAVTFCLIGAVKHINGPTEEQIKSLTAIAILKTEGQLGEAIDHMLIQKHGDLDDWTGLDGTPYPDKVEGLFYLFDLFCTDQKLDDSVSVGSDWCETAEGIIITWNDDGERKHSEVRKMLKMAQGLYGKLFPIYLSREKEKAQLAIVTKSMAQTAKDFTKLL